MPKLASMTNGKKIIKKIKNEESLNPGEIEYYTRLTRIYKDSRITNRTRIYHTKLSEHDEKPSCKICRTITILL